MSFAEKLMGDWEQAAEASIIHLKLIDDAHRKKGQAAIKTNRKAAAKKAIKTVTKVYWKPMQVAAKGVGKVISGTVMGFGSILGILESLGVFEPILSVVKDLLDLFAGKLIEKLMPSFQLIIDILLSDQVMSMIGTLADLFAQLLDPLLEMAAVILPPLLDIILPLIQLAFIPLKAIIDAISPILIGLAPLLETIGDAMSVLMDGPMEGLIEILTVVIFGALKIAAFAIAVFIDAISLGFAGAVNYVKKLFKDLEGDMERKEGVAIGGGAIAGERKETLDGGVVVRAFQTGTSYVPESGIYHLTKGERVTPAGQNNGGGGINITIEGNLVGQHAMRELMDEIEYKKSIGRF